MHKRETLRYLVVSNFYLFKKYVCIDIAVHEQSCRGLEAILKIADSCKKAVEYGY